MTDYSAPPARWAAVVTRDARADGHFVFAVRTTGVFCRPSCVSRPPLRKNVEFFDGPASAVAAGFRACKRCSPELDSPREALRQRIIDACRRFESEDAPSIDAVAGAAGLSRFHFHRVFLAEVGVTPGAYLRRVKSERAKRELERAGSVTAALYEAGYSSSSRFYENAGKELGMAPSRALTGGATERVWFAVRRSSLGLVLVAWTLRGVCDVRFCETERDGGAALRGRFPAAEVALGELPNWIEQVLSLVERPRPETIPLDIEGTAFQQRVWAALRQIPPGETRTYTEVAAAISAPSSARAVARACATNMLAVVIPCHRVVRRDGAESGYAWGLSRKRALLEREAAVTESQLGVGKRRKSSRSSA